MLARNHAWASFDSSLSVMLYHCSLVSTNVVVFCRVHRGIGLSASCAPRVLVSISVATAVFSLVYAMTAHSLPFQNRTSTSVGLGRPGTGMSPRAKRERCSLVNAAAPIS
jgi:hypothetical protein